MRGEGEGEGEGKKVSSQEACRYTIFDVLEERGKERRCQVKKLVGIQN